MRISGGKLAAAEPHKAVLKALDAERIRYRVSRFLPRLFGPLLARWPVVEKKLPKSVAEILYRWRGADAIITIPLRKNARAFNSLERRLWAVEQERRVALGGVKSPDRDPTFSQPAANLVQEIILRLEESGKLAKGSAVVEFGHRKPVSLLHPKMGNRPTTVVITLKKPEARLKRVDGI